MNDREKILNDAVSELGNLLINTVVEHSKESEAIKALANESEKEGGTSDTEKSAIAILPMTFVSMLASIPGSDEMRAVILGQLAGMAFQRSKEIGAENEE